MASVILALRKAEGNLRFYLWASLAAIPAEWGIHYLWGDWSWQYAATYILATLPILWGIARICWAAIEYRRYRARPLATSFVIALMLGRLAYVGLSRPVTWFDWINLSIGVCLTWSGTLFWFASAYTSRSDLGLILSIFWLSQAVSSFGWTLYLWERLNWIIDPSLGIAAFLLLAWRLARTNPSKTAFHI